MVLRRCICTVVFAVASLAAVAPAHAQWKRVTLPGKYDLGYYLDVFFLPGDARYGWASSLDGYAIRTTDEGLTWRGSDIGEVFFESIQFLNRFTGYTSGSNGIFKSTNGGATWFDVTPSRFFDFPDKGWGCYFISELEGFYFVGGCGSHVQQFFRTTNGGATWDVFLGFENNSGLSDGVVNSNGEGFAVSSGVIWRTVDRGRTWRVYARTPRPAWTEEFTRLGNSFLFPISGSTCDGEPRNVGSLMFSSDDARTWRVFETGAAMFGTFLLDERRGWGVGDNGACYYTDDAGSNWQLRNCGLEGVSLDDIWFVNDTLAWIAGSGMFKSNFNAIPRLVAIEAPDTVYICEGETAPLTATDGLRDYVWNTGERVRAVSDKSFGTYIVTAKDPETCVVSADTVVVAERPTRQPEVQSVGGITTLCEGDTLQLFVSNGPFVAYAWNTGDTTNFVRVTTSGRYAVRTLDTSGCWKRSAEFVVTFVALPDAEITLSGPTTFCLDDSVVVGTKHQHSRYLWSTGETTPTIKVTEQGTYSVVVANEFGCIDTSLTVTVTVIRTRNKIDLASLQRPFTVYSHDVGDRACADIFIRNRSVDEPLVIARPYLVGNVTFGIPSSQLPIVIPPSSTGTLTLCCAAIDTGMVYDTLYLADTCSPSIIPVASRGLPYSLESSSRCNVATMSTIIRAGHAYAISAPFPNPSTQDARIVVETPRSVSAPIAQLVDGMFRQVSQGHVSEKELFADRTVWTITIPTQYLATGMYTIVLTDRTALRHAVQLQVIR